ncbi:DUF3649 domain-containing protein [Chitinivorax sp. B]|uniref:DUF3649 domain-containing protein n=1 Tax=Chitinivorax sp. B TaxID=2502235 RepID=UPI002017A18D|nr:DUF3649 domain-containing protein [Chitinivorax sp. B]
MDPEIEQFPATITKQDGTSRWQVTSRVMAAIVGGYGFAYGATAFLTAYLPMSRVNRVVTASMLCFIFYCAGILYAFACRSTWRAWGMLVLSSILLSAAAMLPGLGVRP